VASKKSKQVPQKKIQQATVPKKQKVVTKAVQPIRSAQKNYLTTEGPLLPGRWQTNIGIFLLFIAVTAAIYSSDLNLGFFSVDDEGYVIKNPWIKNISFQNIIHILTTPYFVNYSPMHIFSYMLDYAIGGSNAYVFHLSSNIWAGIVAGFVFLTALALTGKHIIAIPAAVLFILHPSHVEAVTWISSRKDLVAAAFALPSLLAYLKYRKSRSGSVKWYILSLVFFLLALAGKVSVATFPAVLLALDLFVEKRPFIRSLIDKIPYLLLTIVIALIVYSAQPLSGNNPSPYVFSIALVKSLWLLTGFGKYVIYRLRPEGGGAGLEIAGTIFLLILFSAPLLLRKRMPIVTALIYWILFGLLPAQLLSFVHPVTDRYLFFPSVAAVILIAWGIYEAAKKITPKPYIPALSFSLLIAFFWGWGTLNYLSEWHDPRSIWYTSLEKSSDPDIPYSLGGFYVDIAGRLGTSPRSPRLSKQEEKRIATAIWPEDKRLPGLLSEWEKNQHGGPMEKEFQNHLWTLAWDHFEQAAQTRGTHVLPNLYYKRGLILLDKGDLAKAKKEFMITLEEASLSSVQDTREELTVSSHNALGAIAWREGNYPEALKWYKMAEEEQAGFGRIWVSDVSANRQRMEKQVAIISGGPDVINKTTDPEIAFNMGLHFLDAADQLGSNPRIKFSPEASETIANQVWSGNPQLQTVKEEWSKSQHGGPAEKALQAYLRKLAWDAFEQSLKMKGNAVMSNLFFRRGMLLGESGNLQGAKKEFLTALDEAKKEKNIGIQQEITVISHDALGVLAWTAQDYKQALSWFKSAEAEQNQFGGNWVQDISKKRQQMETMITSKSGK
jgi:tetratricopeptide (TPR) repeat protein